MLKMLKPVSGWVILRRIVVACWLMIFLESIDHLFSFSSFLSNLSTSFLGCLFWGTLLLTIVYLGRNSLYSLALLVLSFVLLGMYLGPFLEPPADPLEHLRRIYESNCNKTASQISRKNKGLWHYSMAGNALCVEGNQPTPTVRLAAIDRTNGLFWGLAAAVLYILAQASGLTGKWAWLSVLICFLFWGTNRFSYFRYYSFAPSFSSIMIYWLWTASFFFHRSKKNVIIGVIAALICLPILWVNHQQEAVFLAFIVLLWLLINSVTALVEHNEHNNAVQRQNRGQSFDKRRSNTLLWLLCLVLVFVLWGLPQFDSFRQWLAHFFIRDLSRYHHFLTFFWHDLYISGRVMDVRVNDTLGIEGILMVLLSFPYLWPGILPGNTETKLRILVLGLLPFLGYLIPLFHYIWASNVKVAEYYRLCYASMFWIFVADFLYRLGKSFTAVSVSTLQKKSLLPK